MLPAASSTISQVLPINGLGSQIEACSRPSKPKALIRQYPICDQIVLRRKSTATERAHRRVDICRNIAPSVASTCTKPPPCATQSGRRSGDDCATATEITANAVKHTAPIMARAQRPRPRTMRLPFTAPAPFLITWLCPPQTNQKIAMYRGRCKLSFDERQYEPMGVRLLSLQVCFKLGSARSANKC